MEAKLFTDLLKIQASEVAAGDVDALGSPLTKLLVKHASVPQAKKLLNRWPAFYRVNDKGVVIAARRPANSGGGKVPVRGKSSKGGTNHGGKESTMSVVMGTYGHEAGAKRECEQFMHPDVFQYQSALFPQPRDHGVDVKVNAASPQKVAAPVNLLNPWSVKLDLTVQGPKAARMSWCQKFEDRIRTQRIG